ncbi:MAG TPA: C-GCAxxG-C-C family protein [Synergistales bacterium]|nr:C-GCAxxG-C-C family protein [Synergistales bacterium]HQQ11431.1 C-GCAxxG-C-C family protein [Synergistales bacterium]
MAQRSPSETGKNAEDLFSNGLFCAESTVLAIAASQGMESEILPRAATGFCSGMARTCGTCGALSGAIMGLGLVLGRDNADGSVERAYEAVGRLIRRFEEEFGSTNCMGILDCDLGTPEGQALFRENNLRELCTRITGRAAVIAAELLDEIEEKERREC